MDIFSYGERLQFTTPGRGEQIPKNPNLLPFYLFFLRDTLYYFFYYYFIFFKQLRRGEIRTKSSAVFSMFLFFSF